MYRVNALLKSTSIYIFLGTQHEQVSRLPASLVHSMGFDRSHVLVDYGHGGHSIARRMLTEDFYLGLFMLCWVFFDNAESYQVVAFGIM